MRMLATDREIVNARQLPSLKIGERLEEVKVSPSVNRHRDEHKLLHLEAIRQASHLQRAQRAEGQVEGWEAAPTNPFPSQVASRLPVTTTGGVHPVNPPAGDQSVDPLPLSIHQVQHAQI